MNTSNQLELFCALSILWLITFMISYDSNWAIAILIHICGLTGARIIYNNKNYLIHDEVN